MIRAMVVVLSLTLFAGLACERRSDDIPASDATEQPAKTSPDDDSKHKMPEGEPSVPTTDGRAIWVVESIGPLKIDMSASELNRVIGEPEKKTDPEYQGATGDYVTSWTYEWATLGLISESEKGPWSLGSVTVEESSDWKTERGIGIGASRAEVEKAYAGDINESEGEGGTPEDIVVGTIYGGIIFDFDDGRVSRIFVGATAE